MIRIDGLKWDERKGIILEKKIGEWRKNMWWIIKILKKERKRIEKNIRIKREEKEWKRIEKLGKMKGIGDEKRRKEGKRIGDRENEKLMKDWKKEKGRKFKGWDIGKKVKEKREYERGDEINIRKF